MRRCLGDAGSDSDSWTYCCRYYSILMPPGTNGHDHGPGSGGLMTTGGLYEYGKRPENDHGGFSCEDKTPADPPLNFRLSLDLYKRFLLQREEEDTRQLPQATTARYLGTRSSQPNPVKNKKACPESGQTRDPAVTEARAW